MTISVNLPLTFFRSLGSTCLLTQRSNQSRDRNTSGRAVARELLVAGPSVSHAAVVKVSAFQVTHKELDKVPLGT